MSQDIFALATRRKLTFATPAGLLTTQDLWDLPLISSKVNVPCLDNIAMTVAKQIKDTGEITSFVTKSTSANTELNLKLDVVKYIIAEKVADQDTANKATETRQRNDRIRELIATKKDGELATKSIEELQKLLD